MIRKVYLHGELGGKHGTEFDFAVETGAEAVRALIANFPDIMIDLREGMYHIVRGESHETGDALSEVEVSSMRLGSAPLHIVPAIAGAKSGAQKAILGIALVAMSFGTFGMAGLMATPMSTTLFGATTYGNMAGMIGLSMAVTGVSSMLAPDEDKDDSSFNLSGVAGLAQEGTPIPLVYGRRVMVQGMTISASVEIDKINRDGDVISGFNSNRATLQALFGDDAVST
jgi:predicted phage tail protein